MTTPKSIRHASPNKNMAWPGADAPANPSPRRVLGELTPNARIPPRGVNIAASEAGKTTPITSPLKTQRALTPAHLLSIKENYSHSPSGTARKRNFDAVGGREDDADAERRAPIRAVDTGSRGASPVRMRVARPPIITILPLPDDEDSSTDEDSPTLPQQHVYHQDHQELQSAIKPISGSFSSLIDYDPANASDKSERAASSSPPSRIVDPGPMTSVRAPTAYAPQVTGLVANWPLQRVELLKLRLRIAMYKVNTNQTHIPFSSLRLPHTRALLPYANNKLALLDHSDDSDQLQSSPPPPRSSERPQDRNITITAGPVGKLLPAPTLVPTEFSTRFLGPSSSPNRTRISAPGSGGVEGGLQTKVSSEGDLASPVVEGKAAVGLLELMKAR